MSHKIVEIAQFRLSVVAANDKQWQMLDLQNRHELKVGGDALARFWNYGGQRLAVNYLSHRNGAIFVDAVLIPQLSSAFWIPDGSLVEIQDDALHITTQGLLPKFLAGNFSSMELFEGERLAHPAGGTHMANAYAVWEDTAVSPDHLPPVGRAVYDRIVEITGREHRDN